MIAAGGMESMSRAPYLLPRARDGHRLGHGPLLDAMILDGLWDPYNDFHMGSAAEGCARDRTIDRAAQDAYATESYRRAQAAVAAGAFAGEIVAVEVPARSGTVSGRRTTRSRAESTSPASRTLRPSFEKEGTITAANASTLADGAAALVVGERGRRWRATAHARALASSRRRSPGAPPRSFRSRRSTRSARSSHAPACALPTSTSSRSTRRSRSSRSRPSARSTSIPTTRQRPRRRDRARPSRSVRAARAS